jgi:hypothetical protein
MAISGCLRMTSATFLKAVFREGYNPRSLINVPVCGSLVMVSGGMVSIVYSPIFLNIK